MSTAPIEQYATRQKIKNVQRVLTLCRKLLGDIQKTTTHASFGEAMGHMSAANEALDNSLGTYGKFKDGE